VVKADFHFEIVTPLRTFLLRIDRTSNATDPKASGMELAEWISALRKAKCKDINTNTIRKVRHLAASCGHGLLDSVHRKQREYAECRQTPLAQRKQRGTASEPEDPVSGVGWIAGWLWRFDDGGARWQRLWCVLQGRALLCYTEAHSEMDDMLSEDGGTPLGTPKGSDPQSFFGAGSATSPAVADSSPQAAQAPSHFDFPVGVIAETPVIVLWASRVQESSDCSDAPSNFTFHLHSAASGRRHRLCSNTAAQRRRWMEMLQAACPPTESTPAASPALPTTTRAGGPPQMEMGTPRRAQVINLPSPDTTFPPTPASVLSVISPRPALLFSGGEAPSASEDEAAPSDDDTPQQGDEGSTPGGRRAVLNVSDH